MSDLEISVNNNIIKNQANQKIKSETVATNKSTEKEKYLNYINQKTKNFEHIS